MKSIMFSRKSTLTLKRTAESKRVATRRTQSSSGGGEDPARCLLLATRAELVEAVTRAAKMSGVICQQLEDPVELVRQAVDNPPDLCILSDALVGDVAVCCEQLRGLSRPVQVILLTAQTQLRDRELLQLGVDNFLLDPPSDETLRALFDDFLDTRKRLKNLQQISLNTRKQKIFEEISNFGSQVQAVKKLKEQVRELEERQEEVQVAKERLAAEIRARDKELRDLKTRFQAVLGEGESLRGEITDLRRQLDRSRDQTAACLEVLDHVSGGLQRAIDGDGNPFPRLVSLDEADRNHLLDLEHRTREADRIFDELLSVLTGFASGREPDVEAVFDKITDLLVEYTSI